MSKLTRRVENLEARRHEHREGRTLYTRLLHDPRGDNAVLAEMTIPELEATIAYLDDLYPHHPDVSEMTLEQLDAAIADLEAQLAEDGDDPPAAALT